MLILINNLLKLFDLFDIFNNLGKIRIQTSVYLSLDSSLIILVWSRKGLFLLKIITFKY